jgi:hypothetical protein
MSREDIVPEQMKGMESNTESARTLDHAKQAMDFFEVVKKRLRNVNHWHAYAGVGTADFRLTDDNGHELDRPVEKGDFFRIDIPGPGTKTGEGYDWVQVEAIEEKADVQAGCCALFFR